MGTTTATCFIAALASLAAACDSNESGNVSSTKVGNVTQPAERKSPLAELQQACGGAGAMLSTDSTIPRNPYLQQVTTTGAIVGWVSTLPDEQRVEVTTPDGKPIQIAAAEPEQTKVLKGAQQLWAKLAALQPDTLYCYRVLAGDQPVSERIGFRTAPAADSPRNIGVLVFGDSGDDSTDQWALRSQMEDVDYQLILHTGDLAYDDGTLAQFETTVFDVYDGLLKHIPFYPTPGNHDYKTASGAAFREVFNLPTNGKGETSYSYDWGRIHFAVLDTERGDDEEQARWLDEDLAASELPWKIVYLHRPPYSSGNHGSNTGIRKRFAPIFEKHGVQLVLAGHDHHYERVEAQNGVHYVVSGGGGKGTYDTGASDFTAFAESVIHYVYLDVGTDKLVLHAIDGSGKEFDSVVIAR